MKINNTASIRNFLAAVGIAPEHGNAEAREKCQEFTPEQVNCLIDVLSTLSPREEDVLKRHFGLMDGKPMRLEDLGQDLCVTRERIRQIEAKAIRKLRHPDRMRMLQMGFPEYAQEPVQDPVALVADDPQDQTLLEALDLSPRTLACLQSADITRVGQLRRMRKLDLAHVRNIGRRGYDEVVGRLKELGLSLAS